MEGIGARQSAQLQLACAELVPSSCLHIVVLHPRMNVHCFVHQTLRTLPKYFLANTERYFTAQQSDRFVYACN